MSRIHEYLPETLKDVIDLKLLNEDLDIELEQLDGYITGIGKEVIVKSASLYGIEKWEKALGITPKDGDSLETRRFRVNNLLTSKLPYTYRWLIKKLTQITGSPSGYTLNINQADYAITIVLSGLDTNMMIEVQKQLRNAIPSNMVLEIGGPPLVSADIKVGTALRIGTKYVIKSAKTGLPGGKNLFDESKLTLATEVVDGKNCYKIAGINTSTANRLWDKQLKENTQYTISMVAKKVQYFNIIYIKYTDGTASSKQYTNTTFETISATSVAGKTLQSITIDTGSHTATNYIEVGTIQLEEGTTASTYEPFIEL